MEKSKLGWIKVDYSGNPNVLSCSRCRSEKRIKMPISAKKLLKILNEFEEKHKGCKLGLNNESA